MNDLVLTNKERQATAQKENLVSTSPAKNARKPSDKSKRFLSIC